jgi:sugar (pentulose or hexulose) kinase
MTRDLVLTIDVGTGSSRACVYSISQNLPLAVAAREPPIQHPTPDHAEWESPIWWQLIIEAMTQAVAEADRPAGAGLTISQSWIRLCPSRTCIA